LEVEMAKISAEEKKLTRDKIKTASRKIFREYGFRDAQIKMIAKEAGTGVSTIYGYYPSKVELFTQSFIQFDDQVELSDEEIVEYIEEGLVPGLLNIIDKMMYLDHDEDYDLLRTFFMALLLNLTEKKYKFEDIFDNIAKKDLFKRVLAVYETTHEKLCDFDIDDLAQCLMDTIMQIGMENIISGNKFCQTDHKVKKHLELVLAGKYVI
jgi:AcrR family transcriptional regulator